MKKLILASALASSALTGTAYAEGTGPYVTIEGGAVKQESAEVYSPVGYAHTDRFKTGWEAGAAVGYDFGHFRLEAEGFYDRSILKSQTRPGGTPLPNGVFLQSDGLQGETSTYAGMGNILFGLGHWGGIKAYVGGGVGYARTHLVEVLPGVGQIRDHDEGFAWQGLAGLTMPISHNVDFGIKYRYFRPDGANHFTYSDGTDRKVSLQSHSLLATLTVNFGHEAAEAVVAPAPAPEMAPPPPPPPPPPAPVAVVCDKGPFITFFDWDKSDVSPEAASILDSAIQTYGRCGSVPIMLAGYTDSSGTPQYNLGLAARRDAAVESYLTGHGVAANVISTRAYGEANQRVPTADGVRELQNRRVEITYGPGSGN
jgi:outer membrane protein OmpA-like peptidoglycan-associated protein